MELTIQQIKMLLAAMQKYNKPATVDWTNQYIRVLSDTRISDEVQLSDGPMQYQDILFHLGS